MGVLEVMISEEDNKKHANDLGYDLICDGQYTPELEREWNSILKIVPDYYLSMWLLTVKSVVVPPSAFKEKLKEMIDDE